ncbi:uncharacterized protein LOC111865727 isoform X2 [Cryptotermes secundus]|uniref:uncharacterized protein LOC111865727 isoform X2 n=1 Tax=Cryptotermes secundus TaxID=105785 RepID=UPI001454DED8|nr:uncharacterized protein LOC111865727 isoform X2 [Cryptotermes secundus]
MVILATLLVLHGASLVGSMPGAGAPENITIVFLSPNSVKVSWSATMDNVEKYDVNYKPTNARISDVVAGNSNFITLNNLVPSTQYQVTVVAVKGGRRYRSRPTIFLTMEPPEPPNTSAQRHPDSIITGVPTTVPSNSEDLPSSKNPQQNIQVRGVEVGIVLLVLVVWIAAIALFFNRWGKIRMLLPYQPDYKEQLKVPGSGACAAVVGGGPCSGQQHGSSQGCPQHLHWSAHQHFDFNQWPGPSTRPASRPRVNSAIYIHSALGAGGHDSEFSRLQPFRSELWRRARSAENIPLSGMDPQQHPHHGADCKNVIPAVLPVLSISGPSPPEEQLDQHF